MSNVEVIDHDERETEDLRAREMESCVGVRPGKENEPKEDEMEETEKEEQAVQSGQECSSSRQEGDLLNISDNSFMT